VTSPGEPAVDVRGLCKEYSLDSGFTRAWRPLLGRKHARYKRALAGVDLSIEAGSTVGLIGRNGSGKTTLLRTLAGAIRPSAGTVSIRGRVAALIDLTAGIDLDFSGRENALLLGMLAGATRRQMTSSLEAVRSFSGLGRAFDEPARTYSQGMTLRLAFAATTHAAPDVLLIDEVLAVGDAFFQQRCMMRIRELQQKGCTVLVATHDPSAVFGFCGRAIWLEHGRVVADGTPDEVVREYANAYYRDAAALDEDLVEPGARDAGASTADDDLEPALHVPSADRRFGDGTARVEGIALRNAAGRETAVLEAGALVRVVVTVRAHAAVAHPNIGFSLRNRLGEVIAATNTSYEGRKLAPLAAGERITVEFAFRWPSFVAGAFSFSPAVADGGLDQHRMSDWIDNAIVVHATHSSARYGWLRLDEVGVRSRVERVAP
jgi:ABC-type polysaccharide/polyol phosphate transport system ATPase subunit